MERPLRLIAANPLDALARVVEALLVVASAPLSTDELCEAAEESGGPRAARGGGASRRCPATLLTKACCLSGSAFHKKPLTLW